MLAEEPENTPIAEDVTTTSPVTTTAPTTTNSVTTTAITDLPKPLEFTNTEAENLYNPIWENKRVWEREEMEGATLLDVDFDGTPEFLLRHMNTLSIFKFEDNKFKEFFTLNGCRSNISLYIDINDKKSWALEYEYVNESENYADTRLSLFDFASDEVTEYVKYSYVITRENRNEDWGEKQYFVDGESIILTENLKQEYEKNKEDGASIVWHNFDTPQAYYWQREYLNFIEVGLKNSSFKIDPNPTSWYFYKNETNVYPPDDENTIQQSLVALVNAYVTNDTEYLMRTYEYSHDNAGKPVIYLYPEETTDIDVKITFPDGHFTCTYPDYENGWSVTAYADGTVINKADGLEYSYLYWEGEGAFNWDFSSGFVVKGSDTVKFLREKLSYMGLTPREYNEFIVYWLPLMQNNEYNLISFQSNAYTDNAMLDVSPKPDSLLRVFMAYKSLESPFNIPEQILKPFERKGFTVVEWGGTCAD